MKIKNVFTGVLVLSVMVFFVSSDLQAQEKKIDYSLLVGAWEITMESPMGGGETIASDWVFSMKKDTLMVSVASLGGGRGGGTPETILIKNVKFDGVNVSFYMNRTMGDQDFTIDYRAKLKEEKLAGTLGVGDMFSMPFSGKKKKK
ncbi:hypothetical protein ACFL7D_09920 [candidate division KSB1 bacterium]